MKSRHPRWKGPLLGLSTLSLVLIGYKICDGFAYGAAIPSHGQTSPTSLSSLGSEGETVVWDVGYSPEGHSPESAVTVGDEYSRIWLGNTGTYRDGAFTTTEGDHAQETTLDTGVFSNDMGFKDATRPSEKPPSSGAHQHTGGSKKKGKRAGGVKIRKEPIARRMILVSVLSLMVVMTGIYSIRYHRKPEHRQGQVDVVESDADRFIPLLSAAEKLVAAVGTPGARKQLNTLRDLCLMGTPLRPSSQAPSVSSAADDTETSAAPTPEAKAERSFPSISGDDEKSISGRQGVPLERLKSIRRTLSRLLDTCYKYVAGVVSDTQPLEGIDAFVSYSDEMRVVWVDYPFVTTPLLRSYEGLAKLESHRAKTVYGRLLVLKSKQEELQQRVKEQPVLQRDNDVLEQQRLQMEKAAELMVELRVVAQGRAHCASVSESIMSQGVAAYRAHIANKQAEKYWSLREIYDELLVHGSSAIAIMNTIEDDDEKREAQEFLDSLRAIQVIIDDMARFQTDLREATSLEKASRVACRTKSALDALENRIHDADSKLTVLRSHVDLGDLTKHHPRNSCEKAAAGDALQGIRSMLSLTLADAERMIAFMRRELKSAEDFWRGPGAQQMTKGSVQSGHEHLTDAAETETKVIDDPIAGLRYSSSSSGSSSSGASLSKHMYCRRLAMPRIRRAAEALRMAQKAAGEIAALVKSASKQEDLVSVYMHAKQVSEVYQKLHNYRSVLFDCLSSLALAETLEKELRVHIGRIVWLAGGPTAPWRQSPSRNELEKHLERFQKAEAKLETVQLLHEVAEQAAVMASAALQIEHLGIDSRVFPLRPETLQLD